MKTVVYRDGGWMGVVWDERFDDEPGVNGRILRSDPLERREDADAWVERNHARWIRGGDDLL